MGCVYSFFVPVSVQYVFLRSPSEPPALAGGRSATVRYVNYVPVSVSSYRDGALPRTHLLLGV